MEDHAIAQLGYEWYQRLRDIPGESIFLPGVERDVEVGLTMKKNGKEFDLRTHRVDISRRSIQLAINTMVLQWVEAKIVMEQLLDAQRDPSMQQETSDGSAVASASNDHLPERLQAVENAVHDIMSTEVVRRYCSPQAQAVSWNPLLRLLQPFLGTSPNHFFSSQSDQCVTLRISLVNLGLKQHSIMVSWERKKKVQVQRIADIL